MRTPAFIQDDSTAGIPVLVDALQYTRRLINGGRELPWDDIPALISLLLKQQQLIGSKSLILDLEDFFQTWINLHPGKIEDVCRGRNATYIVRVLLENAAARHMLCEIFTALLDTFSSTPLVLRSPSPARWVKIALNMARDEGVRKVTTRDIERSAMYMASLFRAFGESHVDAIILVDDVGDSPSSEAELAAYQAVFNVANYFNWSLGLYSPGVEMSHALGQVDFVISDKPVNSELCTGLLVECDFWVEGQAIRKSDVDFRYATIPEGLNPDLLKGRIQTLFNK